MNAQPVGYEVAPQSRIRRVTAKRMLVSANEIPQVTLHAYADAERLLAFREHLDVERRPSLTLLLALLVADALATRPDCNGTREGGEIRQYKSINLAIAVATDGGLVAPVIKDFRSKSLSRLSVEFDALIDRARLGTLRIEDLTGGTFTISNLGNFGVETFTPLVNPPQLLILGVGKLTPRAVAGSAGEVHVRRHMPLSLSFDHAALDGDRAGGLLKALCGAIEQPESLLEM